jgi:hypothetical protein
MYAYVTFNTMSSAAYALDYFYGSPSERCAWMFCSCCTCCFQREKFFVVKPEEQEMAKTAGKSQIQ